VLHRHPPRSLAPDPGAGRLRRASDGCGLRARYRPEGGSAL